jgi:hypothetical protein
MLKLILPGLMLSLVVGCSSFAPPSPLVTYGGPKTVPESHSEVGLALGTGWALFPNAHSGGHGWFGRYKYGIADDFDLGIDAVGVVRNDKGTLTAKSSARYQLRRDMRFEAGLGIADDSDGKSLNADVALTWGTIKQSRWNYYLSLRLGAARGFPGNVFGSGDQTPADALFPILNLGTQGRISEVQRFIFEGGYGYVISRGQTGAPLIYLSCGLLFDF